MFFQRDVWNELLYWKDNYELTLEVHGARQVGKTYILKKFCSEEFQNFIYVNLAEESGKHFLHCIENLSLQYCSREVSDFNMFNLMKLYEPTFMDSTSTVVLIDEIQESSRVFNQIRDFTKNLKTRFIVTGSYLGKVLDKEFFLPAGDTVSLTMYSMSFPEFLGVFGLRELYEQSFQERATSQKIKLFFELYTHIGGYPAVVKEFIRTRDVKACYHKLADLLDVFVSESLRYFDAIEDVDVFKSVIERIGILGLAEKKGKNLIEELNKIVLKPGDSRIRKDSIEKVIAWLHNSEIIGYAGKIIDGDFMTSIPRARYYFQDLGLAYTLAVKSRFDLQAIHGYLAETYVYQTLRNRYYRKSVRYDLAQQGLLGTNPMFSTYSKVDGELDFILVGSLNSSKIGIEVKWSSGKATTASAMLKNSVIDKLFLLMGDSTFKDEEKVSFVPLYFADLVEYTIVEFEETDFSHLLDDILLPFDENDIQY